MTQFVPSEDSGLLPADVDLGQIFIGREQQLELFHIRLEHWKHEMLTAPDIQVTAAPSPNNKLQGLIVLLYGRGGFGKSTLLKHYRQIALEPNQKLIISEIVDCEFAIEGKRGLFNPPPGREVDAPEYFKFLCSQLAAALKKRPDDFKEYQTAVNAVEDAQKQARGVLDSMQKDDRFAWLRGVAAEELVKLVRQRVPLSSLVLGDEKIAGQITEGISEGIKFGAEQITQVYTKLHDKLRHKLNDYLDPALRLGLALGRDLSHFARNFPILIFFDTYEEVDEADHLLRLVMGAAGARVGWLLAGRDNLWAGYEQRKREVGKVYGYKETVHPGLGLAIDFNAGGVGSFTTSDIVEYFSLLRQQVPAQLALPVVTEQDAERILEITQGVPLAVRIAASLYLEHTNLTIITEKTDGKREIVDEMVQRYLLHTRDDQPERMRLYGLAMLRRADHPAAIAAALGLSPEQARTRYETELSRLQRRYSFIFTEKSQPSLHQEVRYFLRLWLLESHTQPEIMVVNEQLKEAHETALKGLEDHRHYGSLRDRLEDEDWVGVYLDLVEQQFWLDPAEGVRYSLPFMLAAAIYRRDANLDAANIGEFFEKTMKQPYRNWWRWADQSLTYDQSRNPSDEELTGLVELTRFASQRCPTFPQPLPDYRTELEAALWWRLGEAYQGQDDNKALEWYEKALTRLSQQTELREDAAEAALYMAVKLSEEKKHAECIDFLNRALELRPYFAAAYHSRGSAYNDLEEYQRAIADFDRAIELDPDNVATYINRGNAYDELKEHKRALQDYELAHELDPNDAIIYYNRGITYGNLKDYQYAIADFDRAIELDPKYVNAYNNRGATYNDLEDYQRAIPDFDRAIELDSKHASAYRNRGLAYYGLKEYQRAIADFDRAIELDLNYTDAYNDRGIAYDDLKDYRRAIADYDRGIELDPNYVYAYNNRGNAYDELKEHQRAIFDFDRAIELNPKYSDTYYNRGLAFLFLKNTEQARTDYTRSYELDPTDVNALWMAEWAEMSKERPGTEIARRLEDIAAVDPQHYVSLVCKGVALGLRGKLREGLAELEQAIQLEPEHWDSYFWKGMLCAYYYRGRNLVAIEAVEKALEVGLPPVLLTPLHWLEKDLPDFYEKHAAPLLARYEV